MIWLRMGQAMARLNVCRKTLRKYCEKGFVLAEKLPGGHWRIEAGSCDSLLSGTHDKALAHVRKLGL
jgi:predicted site-specific integrase-resolvase